MRWQFCKRHGIRNLSLDISAADEFVSSFTTAEKLCPNQIFNCDETGLNFRPLPLAACFEKSADGRKKSKDRIYAQMLGGLLS